MKHARRWWFVALFRSLGWLGLACAGLAAVRGAVFDYSVSFQFTSVADAGGLMALRGLDPQGLLQVTNIATAPSQDERWADGVAAWSGNTVVYYYTYDPLRGGWAGGSTGVAVAPQDLLTAGGVVAWSSGSTVYYRAYDSLRGLWQGGRRTLARRACCW